MKIGIKQVGINFHNQLTSQMAVQGEQDARGLKFYLYDESGQVIDDPDIQVTWNMSIQGKSLDKPVTAKKEGVYYTILYPKLAMQVNGEGKGQITVTKGEQILRSTPYTLRIYEDVAYGGANIAELNTDFGKLQKEINELREDMGNIIEDTSKEVIAKEVEKQLADLDVTDDIVQEVKDSLEVGSTNYIKNSDFSQGIYGWEHTEGLEVGEREVSTTYRNAITPNGKELRIEVKERGNNKLYTDTGMLSENINQVITSFYLYQSINATGVISSYIRVDTRNGESVYLGNNNGNVKPVRGKLSRFISKIKVDMKDVINIRFIIDFSDYEGTLWIQAVQLEQGDVVSDWKKSQHSTEGIKDGQSAPFTLLDSGFKTTYSGQGTIAESTSTQYGWDLKNTVKHENNPVGMSLGLYGSAGGYNYGYLGTNRQNSALRFLFKPDNSEIASIDAKVPFTLEGEKIALEKDLPTKLSQLENDENFISSHHKGLGTVKDIKDNTDKMVWSGKEEDLPENRSDSIIYLVLE